MNFWERDGFTISTNKGYLDIEVVFNYLNNESYWANGIPKETVTKSIENTALCFGVYKGNPKVEPAQLIGFARVISDLATFAYLADVFILEPYRGLGLSKWLISTIIEHAELQRVRRFLLATNDAHSLYSQYGFEPLESPQLFMQIARKNIYKSSTTET
ncbi:GNAT family N-acetyltransferase [Paenibacillus glycanilyticus]|uniref:N-acetyltransferase n=1 Tax=Paenibacillus glycanilyticus TaxID=126569 RepID=A0ABQ6GMD3_9BACL|nr:GNAT family N-acetyltransferase [Paenibacillus glycanilyticus]GLX70533.1 N-acetyltransferase [Paenibacillus glycanilyticus]